MAQRGVSIEQRKWTRMAIEAEVQDWGEEGYVRPADEYTPPPNELWLNGSANLDTVTGYSNEGYFDALPLGVLVTVELVPEPGNPADSTAVALDIDRKRIGYLRRGMARDLHPEIAAANRQGYRVLAQGKLFEWSSDHGLLPLKEAGKSNCDGLDPDAYVRRFLEIRATWPGDLSTWLAQPPEARSAGVVGKVRWSKADRQFDFQRELARVLGDQRTLVIPCELLLGTTEEGIGVDVYVGDVQVGTCRPRSRNDHQNLISHVRSGHRKGLAKLRRWPGNVELHVLIQGFTFEADQHDFLWANQVVAKEAAEQAEDDDIWKRAEEAALYKGKQPHEWSETIEKRYRSGKLQEALDLLIPVIAAEFASRAITHSPPSGAYTQRAATICRQLKDYEQEVKLLENLHAQFPGGVGVPGWANTRLNRARALQAKSRPASRESAGDPTPPELD